MSDTGSIVYITWSIVLTALALISFQRNRREHLSTVSLSLRCVALAALLLYLFELAMWSSHPASVIQGIKGRYFTHLLILSGLGLFNQRLSPIPGSRA